MKTRFKGWIGIVLFTVAAGLHAAEDFPNKPIRMIVPWPSGGVGNFVARLVADKLAQQLGVPVVVDNKPGASGNIGAAMVAKAPADGYTIMATASALTLAPALYADPGFDLERELVAVAPAAGIPFALFAHPSVPANNIRDFAGWLRANNGKLAYASSGSSNVTFLGMYMFLQGLGLNATHVPYKGGAPALVDVLRGEPPFMILDLQSTQAFVKDGRLKMLAMAGSKRSSLSPGVPTVAETVLPGFDAGGWIGIFAPANTPAAIVQRLNTEITKAVQDPEIRAKLSTQGTEPQTASVAEYGAYIKRETARWAKVVKESGAKVD